MNTYRRLETVVIENRKFDLFERQSEHVKLEDVAFSPHGIKRFANIRCILYDARASNADEWI